MTLLHTPLGDLHKHVFEVSLALGEGGDGNAVGHQMRQQGWQLLVRAAGSARLISLQQRIEIVNRKSPARHSRFCFGDVTTSINRRIFGIGGSVDEDDFVTLRITH